MGLRGAASLWHAFHFHASISAPCLAAWVCYGPKKSVQIEQRCIIVEGTAAGNADMTAATRQGAWWMWQLPVSPCWPPLLLHTFLLQMISKGKLDTGCQDDLHMSKELTIVSAVPERSASASKPNLESNGHAYAGIGR